MDEGFCCARVEGRGNGWMRGGGREARRSMPGYKAAVSRLPGCCSYGVTSLSYLTVICCTLLIVRRSLLLHVNRLADRVIHSSIWLATGVWGSFAVFNLIRLAGTLHHHFVSGPLAPHNVRAIAVVAASAGAVA